MAGTKCPFGYDVSLRKQYRLIHFSPLQIAFFVFIILERLRFQVWLSLRLQGNLFRKYEPTQSGWNEIENLSSYFLNKRYTRTFLNKQIISLNLCILLFDWNWQKTDTGCPLGVKVRSIFMSFYFLVSPFGPVLIRCTSILQKGLVEGSKCPFGYNVFLTNDPSTFRVLLKTKYNLQKASIGDGKCPAGFPVSFRFLDKWISPQVMARC